MDLGKTTAISVKKNNREAGSKPEEWGS